MGHFPGNIALKQFKDQLGETIFLSGTPRRIISLVPSQTELLFDLGLDKEIVGKGGKAADLVCDIVTKMKQFKGHSGINVAYFIWNKPYMVAGHKTFIN